MRIRLVYMSGSAHTKCISAALECVEGVRDIVNLPDLRYCDLEAQRTGRSLNLVQFQHNGGIADIGDNRQAAETGNNLAQELEFLAPSIRYEIRQTGNVAARSRQTRNQAGADRVRHRREHDRDDGCRLLGGERHWRGHCDDDIDLEPHELGRDLGVTLAAALRPAIIDCEVVTLDPTEFAQSLHKSGGPRALDRGRVRTEVPHGRQLPRLLRTCRKRPCDSRAVEQRYELAPFHSIASSARASRVGGTVRPRVLAVWALMTSSSFDVCTTGRSAGLAPLRMRPT